ncbi:leukotriene B4 receptor 1 [Haplochromis burtoni]|uniref:Leukotriene B4 receptor 1-like n=1 Tax=Haplochromis burtoni TaxID=8153 RepID=A0A3Q3C426_HAPBU|nr:leukotriene B4 receptor 1 [Haplochromis burtoni]
MVTYNDNSSAGNSSLTSLDSRSLIPATVLSICFLLGFLGNIAVMILKPNWENMSSLSQSLMLNLAVSDLLCMLTIPVWTYSYLNSWTFGVEVCKLVTYLGYCSVYGSLLTVTAMSIQRYLQVVHFERRLHEVEAWQLLVPLWLVSTILSIPVLVVRNLDDDQHWIRCKAHYSSEGQRIAMVFTGFLTGFVAVFVIAFSYISLYRKVNRAAFFNNPQTTRLIISIVGTVFVLWVPCLVMNIVEIAAVSLHNNPVMKFCEDTWNAFASVTFVNSAVNPLMYAFTSNHLFTLCQKSAKYLMEKFRILQKLPELSDITAETAQ